MPRRGLHGFTQGRCARVRTRPTSAICCPSPLRFSNTEGMRTWPSRPGCKMPQRTRADAKSSGSSSSATGTGLPGSWKTARTCLKTPSHPGGPRNERYRARLGHKPQDSALGALADKRHECRCVVMDLRIHGDAAWQRYCQSVPADHPSPGYEKPLNENHHARAPHRATRLRSAGMCHPLPRASSSRSARPRPSGSG